jgi:DNA repair and recombination protein RAD52
MFTPEQIDALKAPLDSKCVKTRSQAGRSLSYVEGWHAIAEANRIFGFDAWDRETVELRQLGEPRSVNEKMRVAFLARVKITVYGPAAEGNWPGHITREGTGYGSGIAADLGDAFESAIKEAETDAMKRALMTFGNPFGLALYDKEQRGVTNGGGSGPSPVKSDDPPPSDSPPPAPAKSASPGQWQDWAMRLIVGARSQPDRVALINYQVKAHDNMELTKLKSQKLHDWIVDQMKSAAKQYDEIDSHAA